MQIPNNDFVFYCVEPSNGADARGYVSDSGFVVVKGSRVSEEVAVPIFSRGHIFLRQDLVENGTIKNRIFDCDHEFNSPSAASSVVLGRPSSGDDDWKDSDGRSLKQIKATSLNKSQQVSTSLNKSQQVSTSLNKSQQVSTSLNKYNDFQLASQPQLHDSHERSNLERKARAFLLFSFPRGVLSSQLNWDDVKAKAEQAGVIFPPDVTSVPSLTAKFGTSFQNKIYFVADKERIVRKIDEIFERRTIIYYSTLFLECYDFFAEVGISNVLFLKHYVEHEIRQYACYNEYFGQARDDAPEDEKVLNEIENAWKPAEATIKASTLASRLFIPKKKIHDVLTDKFHRRSLNNSFRFSAEEPEEEFCRVQENQVDKTTAPSDSLDWDVYSLLSISKSSPVESELQRAVKSILEERFSNGFPIDSIIDFGNLKRFVKESDNCTLTNATDNELKRAIKSAGELSENKIYVIPEKVETQIQSVLCGVFESGARIVFYKMLFEKLLDKGVLPIFFSPELLRLCIKKWFANAGYRFTENYIELSNSSFIGENSEDDKITGEIKRVWEEGVAVEHAEDLVRRLPFIPAEKIDAALASRQEFIRDDKGVYVLRDRLYIEPEDRREAERFVANSISLNEYASLKDLPIGKMDIRNEEASPETLRRVLFLDCLAEHFDLRGQLIARKGANLNTVGLLKSIFSKYDRITLETMLDFEEEITGSRLPIRCLSVGYETFVRISEEEFVADKLVDFNSSAIDRAIDQVIGDYEFRPLQTFTSFILFPPCNFPWNLFLLESYCRRFSSKFRFEAQSLDSMNLGVVARKESPLTYLEMMTNAVAKSHIKLDADSVFHYLIKNGYLGRKRLAKMKELIEAAKKIRKELN
jgi:hypothetical protein